jgi:hypothetical protein
MENETATIHDFIRSHGLTMDAVPTAGNPHMVDPKWEADHWSVTVRYSWDNGHGRTGERTMTLPYSMGIGHRVWAKNVRDAFRHGNFPGVDAHTEPGERVPHMRPQVWVSLKPYTVPTPPELADVLNSLSLDACGFDNARNFEAWAHDYGYDTDSRKAKKVYQAVGDSAKELLHLLGREAYETLVWNTEHL